MNSLRSPNSFVVISLEFSIYFYTYINYMGFHGSSAGKESICNARDSCSNPGSGRSFGEGIPNPVFLGFLGGLDVKNLPTIWETWVWSLGWEDPLEEDMAIHSNILAWRITMVRGAWRATVHGVAESDVTEQLSAAQQRLYRIYIFYTYMHIYSIHTHIYIHVISK